MVRGVAAIIWRSMNSGDVWREVHVSSANRPEPTLNRLKYLQARGVRCYLHSLASPSGYGISTGMMSLRVHRDDLNKANLLLREIRD